MAAKSAETVTATQLAAMVGRDPKLVRAYLRKVFARSQEQKGARWTITKAIQTEVVKHFKALDEAKAS